MTQLLTPASAIVLLVTMKHLPGFQNGSGVRFKNLDLRFLKREKLKLRFGFKLMVYLK